MKKSREKIKEMVEIGRKYRRMSPEELLNEYDDDLSDFEEYFMEVETERMCEDEELDKEDLKYVKELRQKLK